MTTTSDILIATNPDNPVIIGSLSQTKTADLLVEDKAKQLPKPSGYRILCAIPDVEKEFESGLIKADETIMIEETLTTVLFVVAMGPDCYKDPARFPTGPYCKEGDFILIRPNSGSRLVIHGKEFRVINDDSVEGVVEDPRGIRRK
jgi:co-chaperonin GroES (HSP10)